MVDEVLSEAIMARDEREMARVEQDALPPICRQPDGCLVCLTARSCHDKTGTNDDGRTGDHHLQSAAEQRHSCVLIRCPSIGRRGCTRAPRAGRLVKVKQQSVFRALIAVREEIRLTAEVARPLPLPVLVGDALLETTRPFPIEVTGLQDDVAGAGCASGVTGSPWWNVDVP